jgi:hypothetical protein
VNGRRPENSRFSLILGSLAADLLIDLVFYSNHLAGVDGFKHWLALLLTHALSVFLLYTKFFGLSFLGYFRHDLVVAQICNLFEVNFHFLSQFSMSHLQLIFFQKRASKDDPQEIVVKALQEKQPAANPNIIPDLLLDHLPPPHLYLLYLILKWFDHNLAQKHHHMYESSYLLNRT